MKILLMTSLVFFHTLAFAESLQLKCPGYVTSYYSDLKIQPDIEYHGQNFYRLMGYIPSVSRFKDVMAKIPTRVDGAGFAKDCTIEVPGKSLGIRCGMNSAFVPTKKLGLVTAFPPGTSRLLFSLEIEVDGKMTNLNDIPWARDHYCRVDTL